MDHWDHCRYLPLGLLSLLTAAPITLGHAAMLSISRLGSGEGTVMDLSKHEIACGGLDGTVCWFDYPPDMALQLTATPDDTVGHARFLSWSAGVCAGRQQTCAFTTTTVPQTIAVYFSGAAVTAGAYHTVALRADDGAVFTWGKNDAGQLGDGSTDNRLAPTQIVGIDKVDVISAGYQHTVALKNDGTV